MIIHSQTGVRQRPPVRPEDLETTNEKLSRLWIAGATVQTIMEETGLKTPAAIYSRVYKLKLPKRGQDWRGK